MREDAVKNKRTFEVLIIGHEQSNKPKRDRRYIPKHVCKREAPIKWIALSAIATSSWKNIYNRAICKSTCIV